MASKRKRKALGLGWIGGALITILVGQLFLLRIGNGLARLSYDIPFLFRNHVPADLIMVYIDRAAKVNLGEPPDPPLPRYYHARLLDRLKADGVRLVIYDLLFEAETPDDATLAEAIRRANPVVLVTPKPTDSQQENIVINQLTPLAPGFTEAAAGVGQATVDVDPVDHVVRALYLGHDIYPTAAVTAAKLLDRPSDGNLDAQRRQRWINYYGCPSELRAVNFDQALVTNGLPRGYFQNKIVVVGMRDNVKDQFVCPHRLRGERPAPGPAIQAISALNILNRDWLTRSSCGWEITIVLLWGVLMGGGLSFLRPWNAAWVAILGSGAIAGTSIWTQSHWQIWWPWLVPAVAQSSVAFLWSVGFQYVVETRRRKKLRQAFGAYLSPMMADQIANSEFDLSLGGREVEATVMFTDLEGFTKMSESLPPAEVSKILIAYFNQTTRAILAQNGTIIKYIGDAVMAVWGAPLADPKHAEKSVLAAWGMNQAGKKEIAGRRLHTRIGISSGLVLAGNLGSDFRFDYTLIGDTTNFASRLEGLNKYLGTEILISESTRVRLGDAIKLRALGKFVVVGKVKPIRIYEVLGPAENFEGKDKGLSEFAEGLNRFATGQFDKAENLMREVISLRGKDGPSEFYIKQIQKARTDVFSSEHWDGTIRLNDK